MGTLRAKTARGIATELNRYLKSCVANKNFHPETIRVEWSPKNGLTYRVNDIAIYESTLNSGASVLIRTWYNRNISVTIKDLTSFVEKCRL